MQGLIRTSGWYGQDSKVKVLNLIQKCPTTERIGTTLLTEFENWRLKQFGIMKLFEESLSLALKMLLIKPVTRFINVNEAYLKKNKRF